VPSLGEAACEGAGVVPAGVYAGWLGERAPGPGWEAPLGPALDPGAVIALHTWMSWYMCAE